MDEELHDLPDRVATEYLCKRINESIDYCRKEWNITYAEVIGSLEVIKFDILEEMLEDD